MTKITPATAVAVETPTDVQHALDLHARWGALARFAKGQQDAVRDWVADLADTRRRQDGAAPTWRVDGGTVLQTDPKTKPAVTDVDGFARWIADAIYGGQDAIGRGTVTSLVGFTVEVDADGPVILEALAPLDGDLDDVPTSTIEDAVRTIRGALNERVVWHIAEDALDRLIAEGEIVVAQGAAENRWLAVDGDGQEVPGVVVRPPVAREVRITPTPATKRQVASDLERALGTSPAKEGTDNG